MYYIYKMNLKINIWTLNFEICYSNLKFDILILELIFKKILWI